LSDRGSERLEWLEDEFEEDEEARRIVEVFRNRCRVR